MSDAYDGPEIFSPAVERGISQWNVMSGELERFYAQRMTRITELLAAEPWGGGTEGNAFRQSLIQSGGPTIMLSNGANIVRQIADAGPRLRRTLENSLGTDVAIAQDLDRGRVLQA